MQTAHPWHFPFSSCLPSHFSLFIFNHQATSLSSACCHFFLGLWDIAAEDICLSLPSYHSDAPMPSAQSYRCGRNSLGWGFLLLAQVGKNRNQYKVNFQRDPLRSLAARAVQVPPLLVGFPSVDHFLRLSVKLWCNSNKYLAFVTSSWYRVPKSLLIIWLTGASSAIPNKLVESNPSLC